MAKKREETIKKEDATTKTENDKKFNRFLEEAKLTNDYMKHIATLDTGLIIIMITFLKAITQSGLGYFVAIASSCFVISLAGVIATQNRLVYLISKSTDDLNKLPSDLEKANHRVGAWIAFGGFVLGLAVLAGFVIFSAISF